MKLFQKGIEKKRGIRTMEEQTIKPIAIKDYISGYDLFNGNITSDFKIFFQEKYRNCEENREKKQFVIFDWMENLVCVVYVNFADSKLSIRKRRKIISDEISRTLVEFLNADNQPTENQQEETKPSEQKETVNHPSHYNQGKFEAIDVIEDWKLNFNLGNAVKYIARCPFKQNKLEDLKKARWYIEREIKTVEKDISDAEKDTKDIEKFIFKEEINLFEMSAEERTEYIEGFLTMMTDAEQEDLLKYIEYLFYKKKIRKKRKGINLS